MRRLRAIASFTFAAWILAALSFAASPDSSWHSDYGDATRQAQDEGKLLLIHFTDDGETAANAKLDAMLDQEGLRKLAQPLVRLRVQAGASVSVNGRPIKLHADPAFAELNGHLGLAIVDWASKGSRHYGYVVSLYAWERGRVIAEDRLSVLLGLPRGSLTQRTLIFAVRTHPERPQSTRGQFLPALAGEAERHSIHQASINLQGHHDWDSRFHRINATLPGALAAREVVAESWPGQGLLEAARECVSSWRGSSGHWEAVSGNHPYFAYDMKRGSNGVWYATGIFASR